MNQDQHDKTKQYAPPSAGETNQIGMKEALVIFSLFACMPMGIILLWTSTTWRARTKLLISGLAFLPSIFSISLILLFINLPVQFRVDSLPDVTFHPEINISGYAPQGGRVTINGKGTSVMKSKFSRVVPLKMGNNEIKIEWISTNGSSKSETVKLKRISKKPDSKGLAAKVFCHEKLMERYDHSHDVFNAARESKIARGARNGPRFFEYKVSGSLTQETYQSRMMVEYQQPYECIVFYDRLKNKWLRASEFEKLTGHSRD